MGHLDTINVFIDTEFFDASNLNFESTVFKELVRLARSGRVKVFLTTVTKSEVLAHIPRDIHEAFLALERFRSKGRMLKNVLAFNPVFASFDEDKAVDEVSKKFEQFLLDAAVTILDVMKVDAEAVFKDYFQKKPPFGQEKKKNEFPDAFAQHTLTRWCEDNGSKMYVVGADPDWQMLQQCSKWLIPIVKLQEFISFAVEDEAEELTKKVLRLYWHFLPKIEERIKQAFCESGFYTDDVDGDVQEVTVTRIALGDPQILEVDEESATVSVSVDLDYDADVSYEDDNEGIWDSEDHTWFYRPTKYQEVKESANFEVELLIQFDPNNEISFEVSCSIDKDFRVTVLPTDYELK